MYDKKGLEVLLHTVKGKFFKDFNLGKLTFFKTNGYTDYLFVPKDTQDIQYFLTNVDKNVPLFVIGNGSNLLIREGGIRGVTIKLNQLNNITLQDNETFLVESGVLDQSLAIYALNNGITGCEFLSTIPGTIGGSIVMNAGAYKQEIKDLYLNSTVIDKNGLLSTLSLTDMAFNYRSSYLQVNNDLIILNVTLKANLRSDKETIRSNMEYMNQHRQLTQPLASQKTAGSTFKNPINHKAWDLINEVGGGNLMVGGAKVSDKHSNFLINYNNATANDIENLGELIREKVQQKFGILLEWEIKIVGEYK